MPTIFRKTTKGVAEIETRAHRLTPRVRSMLILVDGKRDSEDLKQLVPDLAEEALAALLDQGFIEVVGETVRPVPAADEPPADPAAMREANEALNTLCKAAVRALAEHLGPSADTLSLRMEKAKTLAELQPLLGQASQLVLAARGRAAADAYAERFPSK